MPDYQQGKIYAIRSHLTTDVYIGATCKRLSDRMAGHRYAYKKNIVPCKSFNIIERGDAYMELIEAFPCNNKDELNKREGEIIRTTLNAVNARVEGRTKQEYREINKEKMKEYLKEYREKHKEKAKEYQKEYRENNNEDLKIKKKEYYERTKNKD